MNIEHFEDLIDRYGPEISQWPPEEQAPARAFHQASPTAQGLLESEVLLTQMLSEDAQLEPSVALRRRVAEVPLRGSLGTSPSSDWSFFSRPLFSMLGFAAVGVFLGWVVPEPADALEVSSEELSVLAFSGEFLEESE